MCSCIARVKRKKPSQGGRLHKNRVNCQSQVQEVSALPSSPRFSGPIGWFGWPLKHISNLQGRPWYQIRKEMACPWPATCRLWAGRDMSPESAPRAHGRAAAFCHGSALRIVGGRRIISSAQQVGMEKGEGNGRMHGSSLPRLSWIGAVTNVAATSKSLPRGACGGCAAAGSRGRCSRVMGCI